MLQENKSERLTLNRQDVYILERITQTLALITLKEFFGSSFACHVKAGVGNFGVNIHNFFVLYWNSY